MPRGAAELWAGGLPFESSVVSDSQFGPDAVVEFEGESPARLYLFPLHKHLDLAGVLSSELSDDGTWIETYATAAKSVTVAFEKSLDRGISAIELRKRTTGSGSSRTTARR